MSNILYKIMQDTLNSVVEVDEDLMCVCKFAAEYTLDFFPPNLRCDAPRSNLLTNDRAAKIEHIKNRK